MISLSASTLEGYERLRGQALGERAFGERGLAVLLRRGLLAWALLWADTAPRPTPTRHTLAAPSRNTPLPVEFDPAVVQILAGMVLASRSEVPEHV